MKLNGWLVLVTVVVLWLLGSLLDIILFDTQNSANVPIANRSVNGTTNPPSTKPKILREYVPPPEKPLYQLLPEKSHTESNVKPLPAEEPLAAQSNYEPLKEER